MSGGRGMLEMPSAPPSHSVFWAMIRTISPKPSVTMAR